MTILELSSSANITKPYSLLSMVLNKPIVKHKLQKQRHFGNKPHLIASCLAQLNNRPQPRVNQRQIPFDSYHALEWQWQYDKVNDDDEAPLLSNDLKSVCFHLDCHSCFETSAVRGNKELKRNALTYWEVTVLNDKCNGTSLMIGVGTKKAKLNSIGYLNLLGIDQQSWGLSHNGLLWHDNKSSKYCEPFSQGPVTIGCLFNGFNGQLSYFRNGKCMGVAFDNVGRLEPVFAMISSSCAQSVFRLESACETFPSLKQLCKQSVYSSKIQTENECLPATVVDFLNS